MVLQVLSDKLCLFTKTKECFELDGNISPMFKARRKVSLEGMKEADNELNSLEKPESLKKWITRNGELVRYV